MTTPHPHPATPPPEGARIESLRTDYRYLMRKAARETFDKDDAIELIHVCMELARMGYTLTADETDWVLKETDHDGR